MNNKKLKLLKKEYDKKHYLENRERILSQHKKWRSKFGSDFYKKRYKRKRFERLLLSKKYYLKNKKKIIAYQKKYHLEHFEQYKKSGKKYYIKNKKKINARSIANYYKKKIKQKRICSVCGSKKNVENHHPDYKKPKNIILMCRQCHSYHHSKWRIKNGELIRISKL